MQIQAPANDRAVSLHRQTVVSTRGNADNIRRVGGNRGLAVGVITATHHAAGCLQHQGVTRARRDRDHVVGRRHGLLLTAQPPTDDSAVGL